MTDLKPCPFCGGEPRIYDYGEGHCLIACSFCCARTHDDFLEEAIATWNRRELK